MQFKIYDAPVSGNAVWAGEVHKLSVNKGLVNTILGTKTSMEQVDFAQILYLEMTVDANGDSVITAADPPLLPRQVILPAVFAQEAGDSRLVQGQEMLTVEGKLKPTFISEGSIPAASITADKSIQNTQLASNSINTLELVGAVDGDGIETIRGAVTSAKIADGTIQMKDLAAELLRQLNPPGTVQAFAGTVAPEGWLMCDGREVPKTGIYSNLWGVLQHSHGQGGTAQAPDSNKFRIPDYRGRFLRGVDGPDGSDADRDPDSAASADNGIDGGRSPMWFGGNSEGVGSVQKDEFRSHTHTYTDSTIGGDGRLFDWDNGAERTNPLKTTSATGGSETRPLNAYVNYIIKL